MSQRVLFRADASREIGTGHVMRCLTLAHELRDRGATCEFVCRSHDGHLGERVGQEGFGIHLLAKQQLSTTDSGRDDLAQSSWLGGHWTTDAQQTAAIAGSFQPDWLIVDHYAIDKEWEQVLRPFAERLMVIDDLADRVHDCDLLLDQNLGRHAADYEGLVPRDSERLLGTDFAMLRAEFPKARESSLQRRAAASVEHVLISLGGVAQPLVIGQILAALAQSEPLSVSTVTVVSGAPQPGMQTLNTAAESAPFEVVLLEEVVDMAALMAEADLAIGAAGTTSWERCCLGLPSIMFAIADNQKEIARQLDIAGAAVQVAWPFETHELASAVSGLVADPELRERMGHAAAALVDGRGVQRVAGRLVPAQDQLSGQVQGS